ncbi:hypothetical protein [Arthrobacter mobilis]|uniref:Uncharacterized protein n=1 Tax=Arthrobacter mobilis TaxID=2724944 RepID=A0A7X6HHK2_9MICC|nr:hypothetical protein [Arthrobacter mobilis]NKX56313.1 hypothetical protein [Arthrobacter mobilis]
MNDPTEPADPAEAGQAGLAALPESEPTVDEINRELTLARQALAETGCIAERAGQDPDTGEIIIEVKDCPEPKPFFALWFMHSLFRAGNYRVNWTLADTRVQASMGRITNREERARNYAGRAVDLLDAAGNTPATASRQILSQQTRDACRKMAGKIRREAGEDAPLAGLFEAIAAGRPATVNPVGMNLAAQQLLRLAPPTRQELNISATHEMRKADDPKDKFFWRTIMYATLPLNH